MEEKEEIIEKLHEELIELQNENRMLDEALENYSKQIKNYNKQIEIYEMVIKKLCGENHDDVF